MPDLGVNIGPLKLKNPVLVASGTFGYGDEFKEIFDLNTLGGIVVKGISLRPKEGNPPPRIAETPCGMLNSIGLENIGVERFLKERLPFLKELKTEIFVNIYGKSIEEYAELASILKGVEGISALEVNISCPNVKEGGMIFGADPRWASRVTEAVLKNTDKMVIVKLSPNVTDIRMIASVVEEAGAHAISLINTITGMKVDVQSRRPVLGNIVGGLSGPAIRPVAVYMVYQVVKAVDIPVIGIGGIVSAEDALEFLIVGARAVQVGTANFIHPDIACRIIKGLEEYLYANSMNSINDIIGSLKT